MTFIENNWHIYPQNPQLCEKISSLLNINHITAQILLNRQISSLSDAKEFLNPTLKKKNNFELSQLSKTAQIIEDTIKANRKILVYGDYDVDGITSTAMLTLALEKIGARIEHYIPHRFSDGYGLNAKIIKKLSEKKIELLITVDCGISDFEVINKIKADTNTKVIILDHHNIPAKLPKADAILNPKFFSENHPLYYLCAAGVVYKFLEFYQEKYQKEFKSENFLDLAAIGTIADVVPLLGENRNLVKQGLYKLSFQDRVGIRYLLQFAGFKKETVSVRDVGFIIAPRLNAAGRLEHASLSVDLLMCNQEKKAELIAKKLQKMNEKRQYMGLQIFDQSVNKWQEAEDNHNQNIIIMSSQEWHAGIIGITASRLVDRFSRPTVLISDNGTIGRGSARSIGSINIYDLLKNSKHFFKRFGGHKQAAGFSIATKDISSFIEHFKENCNKEIAIEQLKPTINIDCQLPLKYLNLDLAKELQKINPFGHGNESPIFYCNTLSAIDFKTVGDGSHLKATFIDASKKVVIDAIGFGLAQKLSLLKKTYPEIIFNLDINSWQGKETPQLHLLDIK